MRIGIDARELAGRPTGVGRYLLSLLRAWSADPHARSHELVLYTPVPPAIDTRDLAASIRLVPGSPGTWWEQVTLPKAAAMDRLNVFFAPAYTAPLRLQVPVVLTIHDLSFVAHPEWFRLREGIRRRWLTRASANRARAIVTVSEFSRREIIDRLGIPQDRVMTIYHGIDRWPSGDKRASRVLFVGSIFNRRHVTDLIKAVERLAQRFVGISLDIVGDNRTFPRQDLEAIIRQEQVRDVVRWHAYVPDQRLGALFADARAFVFVSEYEGFGLTPLEALSAGVPIVVLDTPVAREIYGEAAIYVPPENDVRAAAAAIRALLEDPASRERVLGAAPAVLGRYSWDRAAELTLAGIEGIVRR